MPNDPRASIALGTLTALVNHDREGFDAVTDQFEGGTSEAFAAMARLAHMLLQMLAQTQGSTPEQMLREVGIAMASYNEGLDDSA